jgi:hypothetical protein
MFTCMQRWSFKVLWAMLSSAGPNSGGKRPAIEDCGRRYQLPPRLGGVACFSQLVSRGRTTEMPLGWVERPTGAGTGVRKEGTFFSAKAK